MIIDSIEFFNVGIFRGKHLINLSPGVDGRRPVVLVGGKNGRGKTTLLDGIHYALYGRGARLAKRGDLSWDEYLRGLIHRQAPSNETSTITLTLRFHSEGVEHQLKVERDWKVAGARVKETLTVWMDGIQDDDLAEDWTEFIENLIPSRIAHLFLFDGEQIAALADPERSRDILKTGIYGLLGVDLVERLEQDLEALARRTRLEIAPEESSTLVQRLEADFAKAMAEFHGKSQTLDQKRNELSKLREAVERLNQEIGSEGGTLIQKKGKLEQKSNELKDKIFELEKETRRMWEGALPLGLLQKSLQDIGDQVAEELAADENMKWIDKLKERDQRMLALLKKEGLPKAALTIVDACLCNDVANSASLVGPAHATYGLTQDARNQLQVLLHGSLRESVEAFILAQSRLSKLKSDYDLSLQKLARIPDEDSIKPLVDKRNAIQQQLEDTNREVGFMAKANHEFELSLNQKKRELGKETEDLLKLRQSNLKVSLELVHLQRAIKTTRVFQDRLIKNDIQRIETEIMESAHNLFSKHNLISRVTIDPTTFQLSILDVSGNVFSPHQLSAGERQILAISILWGLSKASGKSLPVFIDTPLGRLDHDHRDNLVSNYFHRASHQVVLLSTEEEITEARYEHLSPWIGRVCSLIYDEDKESSRFVDGEFIFNDVTAKKPSERSRKVKV